jgi:hypothetical protein
MRTPYDIEKIKASMKDPIIHSVLYTLEDEFESRVAAIDDLYIGLRKLTNRIEIQKRDIERLCAENCQLKRIIIELDEELKQK